MRGCDFSFTPQPNAGSKTPPHNGVKCYGYDLRDVANEDIWREGVNIEYLVDAYHNLNIGEKFFKPVFEKLIGVDYVRQMIIDGYSAAEIKARWSDDVERFKEQRRPYLLYQE
jgi:hypothetical protein